MIRAKIQTTPSRKKKKMNPGRGVKQAVPYRTGREDQGTPKPKAQKRKKVHQCRNLGAK